MMRKMITMLAAILATTVLSAQQLPQFSSSSFDDWTYNGVTLSPTNIVNGKITLYITRQGKVLNLISPVFQCQGMDSIAAEVVWYTQNFYDSDFVLSKTALTMAIDDVEGTPIDSVTCVPTKTGVSNQTLRLTLAVPHGLLNGQLRFVSWQADVTSCGAVKSVVLTSVSASPQPGVIPGDVDNNGTVSITDVTELIDYLLSGDSAAINTAAADVDRDGNINIADVTSLIDKLLSGG